MRTLSDKVDLVTALQPLRDTGGVELNGVVLDMNNYGYAEEILFALHVGATPSAPASFSVAWKISQSDDNSTFTDTGETCTAITTVNTVETIHIDRFKYQRYLRLDATPILTGGTSPTIELGASAVLAEKKYV